MEPTPLHDVVAFLSKPTWFTFVYWLLLLTSVAIALLVWQREQHQRTPRNIAIMGAPPAGRHDVVAANAMEDPSQFRRLALLDGAAG
jgi:hypothetical protein